MFPYAVFLSLPVLLFAAAETQPLRAHFDSHDWFRLRDAVAASSSSPFYRGAVACSLLEYRQCERELRRVIAAAPKSDEAMEARGMLIYAAQMRNDPESAVARIREIQALTPASTANANRAALFGTLATLPRQRVSRRRPATVRWRMRDGNLFIPVSMNGKPGEYMLDTGANFSLISDGEARRLGLAIQQSGGAHTKGAGGHDIAIRIAHADRLAVGAFEIRNVVFMLVGDEQQPFAGLPSGSRAVLGIPVALALETMRWHADGRFEVGFPAKRTERRHGNICFDRADPVIRIEYQGKPLRMFLDTGAGRTRFMPLFATEFPAAMKGAKTGVSTLQGVGGSTRLETATLTNAELRVGNRDVTLPSVQVLLKNPDGGAERFHVWGGLDLFEHAKSVTLDFGSMRFSAE